MDDLSKGKKEILEALWSLYGRPTLESESVHGGVVKGGSRESRGASNLTGSQARRAWGVCLRHQARRIPGSSLCPQCVEEGGQPRSHSGRKVRVGVCCPREKDCLHGTLCRETYSQDLMNPDGGCDQYLFMGGDVGPYP